MNYDNLIHIILILLLIGLFLFIIIYIVLDKTPNPTPPEPLVPKRLVAGGIGNSKLNTLAYSDDGKNWTGLGKDIFEDICGDVKCSTSANGKIIAGEPFWVATGGFNNLVAWSENGVDWTGKTASSLFPEISFSFPIGTAVGYNGNIWIISFYNGSTKYLASSPDGKTWKLIGNSLPLVSFSNFIWNGTHWIASQYNVGGNIYIINETFTSLTLSNSSIFSGGKVNDIACKNELCYVVGNNNGSSTTLAKSTDSGITWVSKGKPENFLTQKSIAYNDSMYITTFYTGDSTTKNIFYSIDNGDTWTITNNGVVIHDISRGTGAIIWNVNYWIAADYNVLYSSDGKNWESTNYSDLIAVIFAIA